MREIIRKTMHMAFGSVFVALTAAWGGGLVAWLCALAFSVGWLFSRLHRHRVSLPFFGLAVRLAGRADEAGVPAKGALYFFLGAALVLGALAYAGADRAVQVAALVPLVYGDGMSAIVGTYYGRTRIAGKKSLEGALAGFFTSAALLYLLLGNGWVAGVVALAAQAAELLPVNDNLSMPVVAGALLYLLV